MFLNKSRTLECVHRCQLVVLAVTSPVIITGLCGSWLDLLFNEHKTGPVASPELAQRCAVLPMTGKPAQAAVNAHGL